MLPASFDNADPLVLEFCHFLARSSFPCAGAKSALARDQLQFVVGADIFSASHDSNIYDALCRFAGHYRAQPAVFQSFVVLFRGPLALDESAYEGALWQRLQLCSTHTSNSRNCVSEIFMVGCEKKLRSGTSRWPDRATRCCSHSA